VCRGFLVIAATVVSGFACDPVRPGRPGAAVADAAVLDAGPGRSDAGAGPAAACRADTDCARGACLDAVCSTTCLEDADCAADQVCAERSGGRYCTRRCTGSSACEAGEVCAARGPGDGFCVGPGAGPGGSACFVDGDCASWQCLEGTCLTACVDASTCGSGETCLPLHVGGACAPAGDGEAESGCRTGAECRSGVCRGGACSTVCDPRAEVDACPNDRRCVSYQKVALCERLCDAPEDCGAAGLCLAGGPVPQCATRGEGGAGTACDSALDCASGRCEQGACARDCADGCLEGEVCVGDRAAVACRAAGPRADGEACTTGGDCVGGICAAGQCSRDCQVPSVPCAPGMRCTQFNDGRFCFTACEADADCAQGAFCDDSFVEGPTCFRRGAGGTSARCARDLDCESGRCGDGQCLADCTVSACPVGTACVDVAGGARCAPYPRPARSECTEDADCAAGLVCGAGRCAPACREASALCPFGYACGPTDARCHALCEDSDDCRPGFICQRATEFPPFCDVAGSVGAGGACTQGYECAGGLCRAGRCLARCAACGEGERCLADGYCRRVGPVADGDACLTDSACASGTCASGTCARACEDGRCAAGFTCTALEGSRYCLRACVRGVECPPTTGCAPAEPDRGVCRRPRVGAGEGEACENDAACGGQALLCVEARCRAWCREDADCDAGSRCRRRFDGMPACVPTGETRLLAACGSGAECESGHCVDGRCFGHCADACGLQARCVNASRDPSAPNPLCAPTCAQDADCPATTRCRADAAGTRACY